MILRQFLHTDPVGISYLFGCGGKALAAVVDPVGEIAPYLQAAKNTGMRILYVVDTHLHADHVSAGRRLAEAASAKYVLFAGAEASPKFHGVRDGDSAQRNSFPTEVYTFYDEPAVSAMLATSDFESIQFSRIGEAFLVLASAAAVRIGE